MSVPDVVWWEEINNSLFPDIHSASLTRQVCVNNGVGCKTEVLNAAQNTDEAWEGCVCVSERENEAVHHGGGWVYIPGLYGCNLWMIFKKAWLS